MSAKKEHPLVTSALVSDLRYMSILAHLWGNFKVGDVNG